MNYFLESILDIQVTPLDINRYKYFIKLLDNNFTNFEAESYELLVYGKDHTCEEQYLAV